MKFTKEFKEKWIKALKSGEYKQGKHYLENNNNYCCLGVAAHLCGISNLHKKQWITDGYKNFDISDVPKVLIGDGSNPVVKTLSRMNDEDYSFEEIADWIESNINADEEIKL